MGINYYRCTNEDCQHMETGIGIRWNMLCSQCGQSVEKISKEEYYTRKGALNWTQTTKN